VGAARREVTGLDFSPSAIAFARQLADEIGLSDVAGFVVSDVVGIPDALGDQTFDVVYTSRGGVGMVARHRPMGRGRRGACRPRWRSTTGTARRSAGLARNGLRIELLDEKPWLEWELPWLTDLGGGRWGFPADQRGTIPLMSSLRARRDT
jgi:hypothetical protein